MVLTAALLDQCAPQVSPVLMHALVRAESGGRPLAIGMDRSHGAVRQPETLQEAMATAKALVAAGRKFSVGLAQIHVSNVSLYRLTWEQAFDACQNLQVGQKILWNFFHRATASGYSGVAAVWAALRGYNSGGVHRAISDDYASRVFAYMSSAPPQVQLGRGVVPDAAGALQPNPPSEAPAIAAAAGSPARKLDVASLAPPLIPPDTRRPGESLDIFEKPGAQAGF
ncbi:lytic transglycosylase domain-containing protein [Xenophilus azovorans]|uniref:lytic transglycosylase domain-containing protein n=1 Tax=Xenophilus azovorans TaxID=151755 RepID=UPI00068BC19E|nr:lytic transglycosylase domain-containing protein [Xenophilus azovorans]